MITVKISDDLSVPSQDLVEMQHVHELKHHGVPMRGDRFIDGVESGVLSVLDNDTGRVYTWSLREEEKPPKTLIGVFQTKFRIRRMQTIGETWYEVQEWKWYWPFWDTWTQLVGPDAVVNIKYDTLYLARESVEFYRRREKIKSTVVTLL